tara:strand:+ start:249 stop:395 length:147 start_codon:yes stop_codon:yes gene_type:complete
MIGFQFFALSDPSKGVEPTSPTGLAIIFFGIIFTLGLPLLLILKGRKD